MRFAPWIRKATVTQSIRSAVLIAVPRQQWLRENFSLLRYTYIACLFHATHWAAIRRRTAFLRRIIAFCLYTFACSYCFSGLSLRYGEKAASLRLIHHSDSERHTQCCVVPCDYRYLIRDSSPLVIMYSKAKQERNWKQLSCLQVRRKLKKRLLLAKRKAFLRVVDSSSADKGKHDGSPLCLEKKCVVMPLKM
jgi:hypothetical protein